MSDDLRELFPAAGLSPEQIAQLPPAMQRALAAGELLRIPARLLTGSEVGIRFSSAQRLDASVFKDIQFVSTPDPNPNPYQTMLEEGKETKGGHNPPPTEEELANRPPAPGGSDERRFDNVAEMTLYNVAAAAAEELPCTCVDDGSGPVGECLKHACEAAVELSDKLWRKRSDG